MTPAEILLAAADVIEDGWIADPVAIDAHGRDVFPTHADAIAWSVAGAISRVSPDIASALEAVAAVSRSLRIDGIGSWERELGRTQSEVAAALRKAAEDAS